MVIGVEKYGQAPGEVWGAAKKDPSAIANFASILKSGSAPEAAGKKAFNLRKGSTVERSQKKRPRRFIRAEH